MAPGVSLAGALCGELTEASTGLIGVGEVRIDRQGLLEVRTAGGRVLDLATGSGDLAIAVRDRAGPDTEVVGADFCMLRMASPPQTAPVPVKGTGTSLAIQGNRAAIEAMMFRPEYPEYV